MTRRYFIVIGKSVISGKFEMLFGDYYKQVVRDELYDLESGSDADDYTHSRIYTLETDTQAAIDAKLAELNHIN